MITALRWTLFTIVMICMAYPPALLLVASIILPATAIAICYGFLTNLLPRPHQECDQNHI